MDGKSTIPKVPPAIDPTKGAGGSRCSLKITMPGRTSAAGSGNWVRKFIDDQGVHHRIGPGESFSVLFRQWITREWLQEGRSGKGRKQAIVSDTKTCDEVQLVFNNGQWRGLCGIYSDCGQEHFRLYYGGATRGPAYYLQYHPAMVRMNPVPGIRGARAAGIITPLATYRDKSQGMRYRVGQWMTFRAYVKFGDYAKPNSTVAYWAGYEGQPLVPLQYTETDTIRYSNKQKKKREFSQILFTAYTTGKKSSENHKTVGDVVRQPRGPAGRRDPT